MDGARWASSILVAAGVYNLLWGAWVVLFPQALFDWFALESPNHPAIWQCLGMVIGVYGIGYLIAAGNPWQHWPIVFVGLLGKVLGPIGFLYSYWAGHLPFEFGLVCLFNDVIWWIPFLAILYWSFDWNSQRGRAMPIPAMRQLLRQSCSQRGRSLAELSGEKPTMVVFLRHSGCTFCRMVMSDLEEVRKQINELPLHVVIVHMGSPLEGTMILSKYEVEYWHHISDPFCILYRGFGLQRGKFHQLFSGRVLWRGLYQSLVKGHGIGTLRGDSFYLPGVFVLRDGEVVFGQPAEDATQRPNFLGIALQAVGRPIANRDSAEATSVAGVW